MHGAPSHFEFGVANASRAQSFYSSLLGWTFHPMGSTDEGWIETPGIRGGVHSNDPAHAIVIYFTVTDLDAAVRRVAELGGQPGTPGAAEPGFGRFVECRDDQGVRFGLRQPSDS
ncbi:VOC family protein [Streptomyces sp. NBC_01803]|uniref:VOC family protein n=1 Tax=Streptomyces sp. NBC_01803 TaxID=2975946 RepID=UPI002DD90E1A|nr:VOC family protein [Streptomyces sp. NBC_01803]WSA46479.1 VOC family protein [Streptomyces sp. NBC_01803]